MRSATSCGTDGRSSLSSAAILLFETPTRPASSLMFSRRPVGALCMAVRKDSLSIRCSRAGVTNTSVALPTFVDSPT